MQKVYDVEIDLEMLRDAELRHPGFGAIRAVRQPVPMCQAEVEKTYASQRPGNPDCVNPEFSELAAAASRRSAYSRNSADQGSV